jgi:hypothetical protein
MFWDAVVSDAPKTWEQLSDGHAFLDVRALETDNAGGERSFQYIAIGSNLPNRELPPGFSDIDKSVEKVNASKEKGLGIFVPPSKYRSKEETVKDMFERFAQLGFWSSMATRLRMKLYH